MSAGAAYLDQELFPEVPEAERPRRIYFKVLPPLDREMLKGRGYDPHVLVAMPRSTPEQEIAYLMAKVQGIEEGTIHASEVEMHALELSMKAYNLLSQKHVVVRFNLNEKQKGKSFDEVLKSWGASRHTLRGNSTVVDMQLPKLARKELPTREGKRPKGETAPAKRKRRE